MCGIVGIFTPTLASDSQLRLFMDLLYVDKARGEHATGVIKVQPYKSQVETFKRAVSSQVFLGQEDALKFITQDRGRIYIGHNRYATMGDKAKDDNAHPFTEGHITMVHNGGVDRWALDKLEGYTDPDVVVDSHMLCKTIAEVGIDEAIRRFSGAAALVWWDSNERSLNFLRNEERPLFLCELKDGTVAWASEQRFLDFFIKHEKSRSEYSVVPTALPVGKLISFHFSEHGVLESKKPSVRDIKFTRMEDPNPLPKTYGGSSVSWGWYNNRHSYTPNNTTSERSAGRNPAVDNFNQRVNNLLKMWGSDYKINQEIKVEIVVIEDNSVGGNTCTVTGLSDNTDVVIYSCPKDKVKDRQFVMGTIVNAVDRRYQAGYNLLEIIVSASSVKDVPEVTKPVEKKTETVIYAPTFPMKVNGHTFQDREEFHKVASNGCEQCGMVPVVWDKNNSLLTVYKQNSQHHECWDYVCGSCVLDKELANVDHSTE